MCGEKKIDIFISHFSEEFAAADLVERLLKSAFGEQLNVFVSYKIPVGDQWFPTIIESLGSACVVLVLLSRQSVGKRWINFEAGLGVGADAKVLPYTIGDLRPGDVGFPLSPLQVQRLNDRSCINELLERIKNETGKPIVGHPDIATFSDEFAAVEESLLSSSIYLQPFLTGRTINFELILKGDLPVRLIKLRVEVPDDLRSRSWAPSQVAGHVRCSTESVAGSPHLVIEQYAGDIAVPMGTPQQFERLLPDFTPDMSGQVFRHVAFVLKEDMGYTDWRKRLRCKVFVTNFGTPEQVFDLDKIETRNK
ncbi:MAG TPA: toll/interleukin-1 receptor domain-containing protein [Bryobacteraceae bacterium]|nr:toll/interleukin-1 receptor domain-containing protein [Bryobacteraceae bacterium]